MTNATCFFEKQDIPTADVFQTVGKAYQLKVNAELSKVKQLYETEIKFRVQELDLANAKNLRTEIAEIENGIEPTYLVNGLDELQSDFPQRDPLVTASKTYQKFLCEDAEMYFSAQCLELPVPVCAGQELHDECLRKALSCNSSCEFFKIDNSLNRPSVVVGSRLHTT
ncbi:MAG: hypothetical protein ACR2OA_03875 [Rubripirellula sp.]